MEFRDAPSVGDYTFTYVIWGERKMRKLVVGVLVAVSSMSVSVQADDINLDTLTQAQLEAMPKEQVEKLPILKVMARMAALDGTKEGERVLKISRFIMVQYLRDLYYVDKSPFEISDSELADGTRAFQRMLGDDATGQMTGGEFGKLAHFAQNSRSVGLYLPSTGLNKGPSVSIDQETAIAQGRLEIADAKSDDDEIAWPLNFHSIWCYKSFGYCFDSEVSIDAPAVKMTSTSSYTVHSFMTLYRVTKWEQAEIVSEDANDCRTVELSLNATTREVLLITRAGSGKCATETKQPSLPKVARLGEPFSFSNEYGRAVVMSGVDAYRPDVRDAVKGLHLFK